MESNTNIIASPLYKHTALHLKLIHIYLEGYNLFSKFTFLISTSHVQSQVYFDFKTFHLNHSYHLCKAKG